MSKNRAFGVDFAKVNAGMEKSIRRMRRIVADKFTMPDSQYHILTPEQQADIFLSLTPENLRYIAQNRGVEELNEYVQAQLTNLRNLGRL